MSSYWDVAVADLQSAVSGLSRYPELATNEQASPAQLQALTGLEIVGYPALQGSMAAVTMQHSTGLQGRRAVGGVLGEMDRFLVEASTGDDPFRYSTRGQSGAAVFLSQQNAAPRIYGVQFAWNPPGAGRGSGFVRVVTRELVDRLLMGQAERYRLQCGAFTGMTACCVVMADANTKPKLIMRALDLANINDPATLFGFSPADRDVPAAYEVLHNPTDLGTSGYYAFRAPDEGTKPRVVSPLELAPGSDIGVIPNELRAEPGNPFPILPPGGKWQFYTYKKSNGYFLLQPSSDAITAQELGHKLPFEVLVSPTSDEACKMGILATTGLSQLWRPIPEYHHIVRMAPDDTGAKLALAVVTIGGSPTLEVQVHDETSADQRFALAPRDLVTNVAIVHPKTGTRLHMTPQQSPLEAVPDLVAAKTSDALDNQWSVLRNAKGGYYIYSCNPYFNTTVYLTSTGAGNVALDFWNADGLSKTGVWTFQAFGKAASSASVQPPLWLASDAFETPPRRAPRRAPTRPRAPSRSELKRVPGRRLRYLASDEDPQS